MVIYKNVEKTGVKSQVFCCRNICNPIASFGNKALWLTLSVISTFYISTLFLTQNTNAIAKQSTLTMTVTDGSPAMTLIPSSTGTFGKSGDTSIAIGTDNYTGYTFKIATYNSSSAGDGFGNYIQSITPSITESTFRDNSAYNNQWGYKPSQYVTESNGVTTVVPNTQYYLPAPSSLGDTLDKTTAANATDKTYTISYASKVDFDTPPGTYTYTYVLQVVANPIVFNITYDDNTNDTVTGMPSPNPQAVNIAGGTAAVSSNVTLSNATPTRTGYTFAGWCDEATTFDNINYNDTCSGNTYQAGATYGVDQTAGENITLYAIWESVSYTITFNTNGGSSVSPITRKHGQPLGSITTPTKTDMFFEGWYSDSGLSNKVSENTPATGFTVLYANWTTNNFPTVWSQVGACEFHGATEGNITGSECTAYHNDRFIDTGIPLYDSTNASLDYEIHFHIDHYSPSEQKSGEDQQTFVTDKLSTSAADGKAPGVIFRRSGTKLQVSSKMNTTSKSEDHEYNGIEDVRIFRIDGIIYYSLNNGALIQLQNVSAFNQYFGLSTWFGAYPDNVDCTQNCTAAKRYLTGTLSNMYIKLGDISSSDLFTINFNANGGTASVDQYVVLNGDHIGTLPTAVKTNEIFQGWYDAPTNGQQISALTVPQASATYYAYWHDELSVATIEPDVAVTPGTSYTIGIVAPNHLENHTFTSNDPTVATVNSTTGEVTGVANGITTVTVTGSESGQTFTVSVVVASSICTVTFEEEGGTEVDNQRVGCGHTIPRIPNSIKAGLALEGWFTGRNGTGTQLTSATVIDTNITYYADWTGSNYVCAIATTLHTEQCSRSQNGCYAAGYTTNGSMLTDTITYGNLVNSSTMHLGDAYTCDIDANGQFDETDERFYYIGMNGQNAAFIYYKSTQNADLNYANAVDDLPTTSDWTNPNLVTFSNDRVGRFLTYSEVLSNCENSSSNLGTNGKCVYLMEQSNFSTTTRRDGIWLEYDGSTYRRIQTSSRGVTAQTQANTPRAVIEVPIEYVERGIDPVVSFTISFDPHNEGASQVTTVQINNGDPFGNNIPSVSYSHHLLVGWFDAQTGGNQITASDYPDHSTTYHAQWVKDVTLATLPDAPYTLDIGDTEVINVSNAAELESYTFSSLDSTVASVDPNTGTIFAVDTGTTTIVMTGTESHETKNISVTVTNQISPASYYTVTYVTNGGDSVGGPYQVLKNTAIGTLPTTAKTGYRFFGWYKDDGTFYQEVTPETIVDSDVYYYARFIENNAAFPIVFAQTEECTFNGNSNITGTYCSDYTSKNYINTGVQLFTATNYSKDFEVGFTIVSYDPSDQVISQHTFINSKKENSGEQYPGFVVRHASGKSYIEITEKFDGNQALDDTISTSLTRFVVRKVGGVIKYSIDDGPFTDLQDISSYSQRFDTAVWFGAAVKNDGTSAQRPLKATLTDMYVKQGTYTVGTTYTLHFDGGGVTPSFTSSTITIGDTIGTFPTVTRPNYTLDGWYDSPSGGNQVTTSYQPDSSHLNFYARWSFTPSSTVVSFDETNDAVQDYYDQLDTYNGAQTTFNLDSTTINNSTWGVAENTYWSDMQNVFVSNQCLMPSYHDSEKNWTSGSNDCSKPKGYDTGVGSAVDVYLYDKVNDTVGAQVSYTKSDSGYIYNMIPGQAYYWEDANDSSVYGYVEATAEGNRRLIDAGNIRNVRDLGGLPMDSDGDGVVDTTTQYGILFRGERIWSNQNNVTELTNLGINMEYDLRESNETGGDATIPGGYDMDTVIHYAFEYTNPVSSEYTAMRQAVYDIMYDIVNNNKNIYFHCRVGADRTGSVAYVLEGLLGVPDEIRYEDYELTFLSGLTDRTRYYKIKNNSSSANKAKKFVYMMSYLPSVQSIINWWEAGSSNLTQDRALVQAFKNAMKVPST